MTAKFVQPARLPGGGLIDRSRRLRFTFAGRDYEGYAGDSLASALLANGVRIVGRSFKYHRPRGIVGSGVEEPNALVQLGCGAASRPNVRATEVELYGGLFAEPVNCWPSLRWDAGALLGMLGRFLPAGFYYKTFMWPSWGLFEDAIRRAAGLGKAPEGAGPDRYDQRYEHCDVLVVGGGPAGLAAARAAATTGARTLLVEQDSRLGGRLLWDAAQVEGQEGLSWIAAVEREIENAAEGKILTRATAVGYFDHNLVAVLERSDATAGTSPSPRHSRLWHIRAKRVVLATGAIERPIVFPGNDRPGVMLSQAVRCYISRYAVLPGRYALVFTNNDDGYLTAHRLADAGATVLALVDTRAAADPLLREGLQARGIRIIPEGAIVGTRGQRGLREVTVRSKGRELRMGCDLLAVSGGFNPTVHLFCQSGGRLRFDDAKLCFVPGPSVQEECSIGAAAGQMRLDPAVRDGETAGSEAAAGALGRDSASRGKLAPADDNLGVEACWHVPAGKRKAFVDFQNDVTADDIALSARENYRSVEHLKRYTTLGMANDQGKTSNVNGLAILAEQDGRPIQDVGTTRYRFPYTPVSIGAMGGAARGELFRPLRRTALYDIHAAAGAVFNDYGGWLRPAFYREAGPTRAITLQREAQAVRTAVGLFDASPLGKIEVVGPDAGKFLDRIYANRVSTLEIGRLRYGIMLNELGSIIDDGVVARLAEHRFLVGTTSGGADRIAEWLEEWLQCEWTDLRVLIAPVTGASAVITLAGPFARAVLQRAQTDIPLSAGEFPHMSLRSGRVAGTAVRLLRVSFTGEISFEISAAPSSAAQLWQRLVQAGEAFDIHPIGVEAWMLLRLEKGYFHVGTDTDGTTIPADVDWGRVLKRKDEFIGRRPLFLPANLGADRLQLVGLRPLRAGVRLPVGAHLQRRGEKSGRSEGYVTSSGFSDTLGRGVALAMLRSGRRRMGEEIGVLDTGGELSAVVTAPCALDPAGERLNV